MQIRRAVEADLGAMLDILQAVVAPGDTLPYPEDTDEDEFRAQWFGVGRTPWVAVVDSRICGMYTLGANYSGRGSHVASATYAVGPWAQGRGIGRALVQHSFEQAREAGYLAMQFNYVVSANRAAIALYEKLGFTIVGTLPKAFRHEKLGLVDAHVMYRFLRAAPESQIERRVAKITKQKGSFMSKAKSEAGLVLFCGALVMAQAAHWFISGESATHSSLRNAAVLIQLIAGLVVVFYGWRRWKEAGKSKQA